MSIALRAIPPEMDAAIVAAVDRRLDDIVEQEAVAVPLAIESGSRAWGFPSPDSDYDCRFLYVRPARRYASLYPPRDVIETPADAVLDIGGWDLAKAVRLLVKGNAVLIEWLTSPIVYRGDADFRARMLALAAQIADRGLIGDHYRHLALRQIEQRRLAGGWPLKKFFYALRPAVALRWLRQRPDEAVAPMHFPTLCQEGDLSSEESADIARLLVAKAQTREMGEGSPPQRLVALIERELALAAGWIAPDESRRAESRRIADDFFWNEIKRQADAAEGHS